MTDESIIELYFARSETAIAETDKKYGGCCRSTAYNILQSREDSEECVNDTYMKVWDAIPPERPLKLGAFVIRILRGTAIDLRRKKTSQKHGGGFGAVPFDEISECLPSSETVEDAINRKAVLDAVERFLSTLPREKRIMFVRRYYYCSTVSEISADLGMTEGKVKMSLMRTREKLKKFLEKEGVEI